jgi:periplasmic protein TonB
MTEEQKPPVPPPAGDAPFRSDVDLLLGMDRESPKRVKRIIWGVVAFHILIFFIHFPKAKVEDMSKKEVKRAVIKVLKIIPPPKIPPPEKKEEKKIRVAVPDPTPDEPEPIREPEPDIVYAPPGEYEIGIPDGPPAPVGPLTAGMSGTTIPRKVSGADPPYPEEAKRVSLQGTVILRIIIDEQGNVVDVGVIQGAPLGMTESAVEGVRKWKYQPSTVHGRPVAVTHTVTVRFELK